MIVAVDLSGSRTTEAKSADKNLLDTMAREFEFGDQTVLIRIPQLSGHVPQTTKITVDLPKNPQQPTPHDRQRLTAAREDLDNEITLILGPNANTHGSQTDIIGALFAASDKLKEGGHRPATLVLLSDMIQDARGLNFDHAVPTKEWVAGQKKAGLIPTLDGACVTAVGPDPSTSTGVKIREFWSAYFEAAGAAFAPDRYRGTMAEFKSLLCWP